MFDIPVYSFGQNGRESKNYSHYEPDTKSTIRLKLTENGCPFEEIHQHIEK